MNYITYKITNLITDKIYIGAHKTTNINDGYMGSGKLIQQAIIKHGTSSFKKEILGTFDTPELMFEHEASLVNSNFVSRADTYNMKLGGNGGFYHINSLKDATESRSKGGTKAQAVIKAKRESDPEYDIWIREKISASQTGRRHSEVSIQKMKDVKKNHGKGKTNSQFGTRWYMPSTDTNKSNRKKYKENKQPTGWITTTEWSKNHKI